MPIQEADRAYSEQMRMLARDSEGREVLIGLSYEDTEWYLARLEIRQREDDKSYADTKRCATLEYRHELARAQRLAAEHALDSDKLTAR